MHDARMLAVSEMYDDLENFAFCPAGREMCLHGDPIRLESTSKPLSELGF